MRLPKELDRQLGLYIWGTILFALFWPLAIPWGIYKICALTVDRWCFKCGKPYALYKSKSTILNSYWEKACLDGSPDMRYKRNSKHSEVEEIWMCKHCSATKVKVVSHVESY